jgi:hypothetical protein
MWYCIYVCVCICMYICVCVCLYVLYVCVCRYICMYVCVYVCTYVHMYVCTVCMLIHNPSHAASSELTLLNNNLQCHNEMITNRVPPDTAHASPGQYNVLLPTNARAILTYIFHHILAPACYGRLPFSGISQSNSLKNSQL